jgi:hypothetical protein
MFPPFWGPIFWQFSHASAEHFRRRGTDLTEKESQAIAQFWDVQSRFLPCPACSIHCRQHIQQNPPVFKTGEEYSRWMFEFHNDVNQRTKKLEIEWDESLEMVEKQFKTMKGYDGSTNSLNTDDYWHVFLILAHTFCPGKMEKDMTEEEKNEDNPLKKIKATPEQVTAFNKYALSLPYVFPCQDRPCGSDMTFKDRMLLHVKENPFEGKTIDDALTWVNKVYNSMMMCFGNIIPVGKQEMMVGFNSRFESFRNMDLGRAFQVRLEDHERMSGMKVKIKGLEKKLEDRCHGDCDETKQWKDATISLGVFLSVFMVIASLSMFRLYREKRLSSIFSLSDPIPQVTAVKT